MKNAAIKLGKEVVNGKVTEEWYNYIPEKGVVCWLDCSRSSVGVVLGYRHPKFVLHFGIEHGYAVPLTADDVLLTNTEENKMEHIKERLSHNYEAVPKWANFIAVDADGEVYAYEVEPKLEADGYWFYVKGRAEYLKPKHSMPVPKEIYRVR